MTPALVSAIVLNYNASYETLKMCLESLETQTYQPMEVLLVDNGSTDDTLTVIVKEFPQVRVERLGRNYGFAKGVNQAVSYAKGAFVFILNFDTRVEPTAVEELVKVMTRDSKTVAAAPKMLFYDKPTIFDSVGNLIDWHGAAFNQGIGQVDIGQYDEVERTFGACFGAAMVKKSAFEKQEVGPLDESFFMYYEDIDWCYRANLFGYKIYTAPQAVVYHLHSAATRKLPYSFKYRLIERNLLRTVYKNYEFTTAIRIIIRRYLAHMWSIVRRRFVRATILCLSEFSFDLIRFWGKRRHIQRRRGVTDFDVIKYSHGEESFFSPAEYAPDYSVAALAAMYMRLYLKTGDKEVRGIYLYLRALTMSKVQFSGSFVKKELAKMLAGEPQSILDYVQQLEE